MEQMAEEPQGEHIIDTKTASQFRKELAQNKTVRGLELTSSQREMRERKLEAYDASLKATGKRVGSGKWTEGEELAENKTISGTELTSTEREMREGQLAAYDASTKDTGKRVYKAAKWSKQLCSIEKDTDAIKGTAEAIKCTTDAIHEKVEILCNVMEGGEQPRKEGQSDKARVKQLRVQKR